MKNITELLKGNVLSKYKIVEKYFKNQRPATLEIHPDYRCGFNCTWCIDEWLKAVPSVDGKIINNDCTSSLTKENMDTIITGCLDLGITGIILSGGGNPSLCKATPYLVEQSNKNNIDIGMFVNGSNLTDETIPIYIDNLTFIRFSFDSFDAKNYAKTKGTTEKMYYKVLQNIKKCTDYKRDHHSKCKIGIDFIIIPENIHLMESIYNKSCELKVDYAQFCDCLIPGYFFTTETNELILSNLEKCYLLNESKNIDEKIEIFYEPMQSNNTTNCADCKMKDYIFQVGASGIVHLCPHTARWDHEAYGNINDKSLKEIWDNRPKKIQPALYEYCRFREQNKILDGLEHIEHGNIL